MFTDATISLTPASLDSAVPLVCRPSPSREATAVPPGRAAAKLPTASKIMIVDDEPVNVKVVRKFLSSAGYAKFVTTTDAAQALELINAEKPDVILLDVMMPGISGLEILRQLRLDPQNAHVPVIILTAADDDEMRINALESGATDFLAKPVNPTELVPRVRNALLVKSHHDHLANYAEELAREVQQRTAELAASRLELIHCLARVAEYRDNETGRHVIRVGRYVGIIARQLGFDEATCELLEHAAPLHDMGKIGIPDEILLKPGKLSPDEYEVMQRHTRYGKRGLEPMTGDEWGTFRMHPLMGEKLMEVGASPLLLVASKIALTHHERWDGTGYPIGLSGEQIPIEGRITAVADVFDALSSERPYKRAFPIDECFRILEEGRGKHFDPRVLDAFFARQNEIIAVRIGLADLA